LPVILDERNRWGTGQYPQIAVFIFKYAFRAEIIPGYSRARYLSRLLVQMKQAALTDKPDILMATRDNLVNPADELAIAVISIVSEYAGPGIKPVEAAVERAKPNRTPRVTGDAGYVITPNTVGVICLVNIAGAAFGRRVESVHPGIGRNPEIAVVVLYQVLKKVGT
jgi:hypothetical protein